MPKTCQHHARTFKFHWHHRGPPPPGHSIALEYYMGYHGDLVRHFIRNYSHEVGAKFDDRGTKFDEFDTKYNPGVIKYRPVRPNPTPDGAERCRWVHLLT